MMWKNGLRRLNAAPLIILLSFAFQGAYCELLVTPAVPTEVNAVAGSNVTLAVSFSGAPDPEVTWFMNNFPVVTWTINSPEQADIAEDRKEVLRLEPDGSLTFVNVPLGYSGNYSVEMTKSGLGKSSTAFTLKVFERPMGDPMCSVRLVNDVDLQYHCQWSGGTAQAQLSFPALSNTSSEAENFTMTVAASDNLNGKTAICMADHPRSQNRSNTTARSPVEFLPAVSTTIDPDGKIVVTIDCFSEASPEAVVSWSKGSEAVPSGTTYQISSNTTQLKIRDYSVSNFLIQNYTCTCRNLLGNQTREIHLRGPSISDSSLFPNQEGTIVKVYFNIHDTYIPTDYSGFQIEISGSLYNLILLPIFGGFIYLCYYCCMKTQLQTRAVETVTTTQTDSSPHNKVTGGLKPSPYYNTAEQTPSETSIHLPTFVPPPPIRVATTV